MQDRGRQGETLVAELAAQKLFFDFIYERPAYHDHQLLREVCDLLVVLDRTAICIEIKTREEAAPRGAVAEGRWLRKQAHKAARQVQGSLRTLSSTQITGINRVRDEIRFAPGQLIGRHGLAIFDVTEGRHELPADVDHASAAGIPLHYFSFSDFLNLIDHLRTFPDLVYYLDQRACLRPDLRPLIHAESDAYAYFLAHERSFQGITDRADFVGWWERLTTAHGDIYHTKVEADAYASIIEVMIEEAHELDPDLEQYTLPEHRASPQAMKDAYFQIACELNRLPLSIRREIGRRIYEKIALSAKGEQPRYFVAFEPGGATALAFMVSHLPRGSWNQPLLLILKAGMARLGMTRGVGVALNDTSLPGHAFNFVLLQQNERPGPDAIELAETILGQTRNVSFNDFPALEGRS